MTGLSLAATQLNLTAPKTLQCQCHETEIGSFEVLALFPEKLF